MKFCQGFHPSGPLQAKKVRLKHKLLFFRETDDAVCLLTTSLLITTTAAKEPVFAVRSFISSNRSRKFFMAR